MSTEEQFTQAVADSKTLPQKPDNDTLLALYSLYKQATEGDAPAESGAGGFDFVAKFKHEAWSKLRGLAKETAMQQYTALVQRLKG
jgi:acyl-CoA-binding protein